MRTILIIFTALIILSLPVAGQEQMSNPKHKEKEKTRKHGQKEEKEDDNPFPLRRIEFGLNIGGYLPNKYSANFYNGSPGNVNNLNFLLSNSYTRREIKSAMGLSDSDEILITDDSYPTNMHYNLAMSGGLFIRVNFDRKNSIFLQANYAQLNAGDVLTVKVNPTVYLTFDNIMLEKVVGREGRVMFDFGYQRSFPLKSRINLFVQAAATMCYTQVLKSIFVAEGTEFNLVNIYGNQGYQPGYNNQTFAVNQNAFGFGGYLGVGAGIPLTDIFGLEPGFFTQAYSTNLEGYAAFRPSFGLYLRIMMSFGSTEN